MPFSTHKCTREFQEETTTPLLTSRETVYVMGILKHSFQSEIIQEWLVGHSLLLCQCLVSIHAKAMGRPVSQIASISQRRTGSQLSHSNTLLIYVFTSSFQTVKKTKSYLQFNMSFNCSLFLICLEHNTKN